MFLQEGRVCLVALRRRRPQRHAGMREVDVIQELLQGHRERLRVDPGRFRTRLLPHSCPEDPEGFPFCRGRRCAAYLLSCVIRVVNEPSSARDGLFTSDPPDTSFRGSFLRHLEHF